MEVNNTPLMEGFRDRADKWITLGYITANGAETGRNPRVVSFSFVLNISSIFVGIIMVEFEHLPKKREMRTRIQTR